MKIIILTITICVSIVDGTIAQFVGIGTTKADASCVLELKATNKGFLPPRMTASDKGLIPSAKTGLMIYQTDGITGLYMFKGSARETVAGTATGFGWALNGNSGTNPSNNFIETRDNQPLKFRDNNISSAELNAVTGIVAYGPYILIANSTVAENTAIGANSLIKKNTGDYNTGIGVGTLFNNTIGNNNTALGKITMVNNVSGSNNLAAGSESL